MKAVFKREWKAYFKSPIGYIYLAVFLFLTGANFSLDNILYGYNDMSNLFSTMFSFLILLIPIATMKLFSEEKKVKTDQLLLTSPVSIWGVVFGKFSAALSLYALGWAVTLTYLIPLYIFSQPETWIIVGNYLGVIFLGAAMIAIGVFVSSLTENQFVAAILSLGILFVMLMGSYLVSAFNSQLLINIVSWISVFDRYSDFSSGIFNLGSIIYYITITAMFLFFTVSVVEKKRYA